jgi:hypothetical protein
LAIGDCTHEGGLATAVWAAEAVALAALEVQVGVVQKNLGTIREGKLALAQVFTLLFVFLVQSSLLTLVLHEAASFGRYAAFLGGL